MTLNADDVLKARTTVAERLAEVESAAHEEINALRAKLGKLDAWLWDNTQHTSDTVIAEFVALRDERSVLKERYESQDKVLKDGMATREAWLLEKLSTDNLESIRTDAGTAYTQTKSRYNVTDWNGYWNWLGENKRFDLLEKRPAQGALAKMQEEGEEMPPGLNVYRERTVTVRRA